MGEPCSGPARRGAVKSVFGTHYDDADIWDSSSEGSLADSDEECQNRKPPARAPLADKTMKSIVRKAMLLLRKAPLAAGVGMNEIHQRNLKRYETTWHPPLEDEKNYMDAVLRSKELMFKMTSLVRDVGEASHCSGKSAFRRAVSAFHHCKIYTMRHIWAMHVAPLAERLKDLSLRYEYLKKKFQDARSQYLSEVSSLRGERRNEQDPSACLSSTGADDIRYWFDPTSCLSDEELAFVARVVKEQVKMIVEVNPNVSVSTAQLGALEDRKTSSEVHKLKEQLAKKDDDIAQLNATVRGLEKASADSGTSAPHGHVAPQGTIHLLEQEMDELRDEVRCLRKERQAYLSSKDADDEQLTEMRQELTGERKRNEVLTHLIDQETKGRDKMSAQLETLASELEESLEDNTELQAKITELETQLSKHNGRKLDTDSQTSRRGSLDRRVSIAARTEEIEKARRASLSSMEATVEFERACRASLSMSPGKLAKNIERQTPETRNASSQTCSPIVPNEIYSEALTATKFVGVAGDYGQAIGIESAQDVSSDVMHTSEDARTHREVTTISLGSSLKPTPAGRLLKGSLRNHIQIPGQAKSSLLPPSPRSTSKSPGPDHQASLSPTLRSKESPLRDGSGPDQPASLSPTRASNDRPLRDRSGRPLPRAEVTSLIQHPRAAHDFARDLECEPPRSRSFLPAQEKNVLDSEGNDSRSGSKKSNTSRNMQANAPRIRHVSPIPHGGSENTATDLKLDPLPSCPTVSRQHTDMIFDSESPASRSHSKQSTPKNIPSDVSPSAISDFGSSSTRSSSKRNNTVPDMQMNASRISPSSPASHEGTVRSTITPGWSRRLVTHPQGNWSTRPTPGHCSGTGLKDIPSRCDDPVHQDEFNVKDTMDFESPASRSNSKQNMAKIIQSDVFPSAMTDLGSSPSRSSSKRSSTARDMQLNASRISPSSPASHEVQSTVTPGGATSSRSSSKRSNTSWDMQLNASRIGSSSPASHEGTVLSTNAPGGARRLVSLPQANWSTRPAQRQSSGTGLNEIQSRCNGPVHRDDFIVEDMMVG